MAITSVAPNATNGVVATKLTIGNFTDLDLSPPGTFTHDAELAALLVGQTFNGDNGLDIRDYIVADRNAPGDRFSATDDRPDLPQQDTFTDTSTNLVHRIDNEILYNTTVVYLSGGVETSVSIVMQVLQSETGEVIMQPQSTNALDNLGAIISVRFDSVSSSGGGGIFRNDIDIVGSFVLCFADTTHIETSCGLKLARDIQVGDLVRTHDHGFQAVRWVNKKNYDSNYFINNPKHRPIIISKGALGDGKPNKDLMVSPHHRLLLGSKIAKRMFSTDSILIAAKYFTPLEGVRVFDECEQITYVHFMFDQHEIVFANGMEAESLFVGDQAQNTLSDEAMGELFELFPELRDANYKPDPSRMIVTHKKAHQIINRHIKSNVSIC